MGFSGRCAQRQNSKVDFSYGSKCEVASACSNVRFAPDSDQIAEVTALLKSARNRPEQVQQRACRKLTWLDHLVGAGSLAGTSGPRMILAVLSGRNNALP